MNTNHFDRMGSALRAEAQSPHPDHKVGALICGTDQNGQYFEHAHHNFWPDLLKKHIGTDQKLGNASTTIHAEMATLFMVPSSRDADIYITDLPCPNCAKTIAQAGIRNVYIDSHTHNTPLGLKIKPYFDQISMLIFRKAGIGVFEMNAPEKTISCLQEKTSRAPQVSDENSYHIRRTDNALSQEKFGQLIQANTQTEPFAACIATDHNGNAFFIHAKADIAIGLSQEDAQNIRDNQDKYVPTMQPINRLLVLCTRHSLTINPAYIFSSRTPTSREFVNLIGAGYTHLTIGNQEECRDEWGLKALKQLQDKNILDSNLSLLYKK